MNGLILWWREEGVFLSFKEYGVPTKYKGEGGEDQSGKDERPSDSAV